MYTLGGLMVSSDDDMRPFAFMENSPESLGLDEVSRGKLYKMGQLGYTRKSFDMLAAFLDVLGKRACEVPDNYDRGELLIDTATDLETNVTKGLARENSLMLQPGPVPDDSVVKMAQTFRSGTHDIDAVDFVDMFLDDEGQTSLDDLNDLYVLVNFRPVVTKKNWRMAVAYRRMTTHSGCPHFSPRACASKTTSTGCGSSSRAWPPRTWTPPRTTARATTCATHPPRRSSTKKWPIC
jgi:hypothetical protein